MTRLLCRASVLLVILVCTWDAMPAVAQYSDAAGRFVMRVHVTDRANQIPALAALRLDLAGVDVKASTADFAGDWASYEALRAAGFQPEIVWTQPAPESSAAAAADEALSDYVDPDEVAAQLESYQAAFPSLAKKVQIATTANGRPEWALKISDNVTAEEDEPVVFFDAQHHAREVMASEIAMDIIGYLLNRYAIDPQVKAWVDGTEIWVIPCHNPDGSNFVFTSDSSWRKNRRNNGDGSFGVDPNRNYPFAWGACEGSSGVPQDDTYRGPSPGSEPETQGYMALALAQRPIFAVSYHTYAEFVLHPWGCEGEYTDENRLFRDLSSDMASRIRNDSNTGWYANGTSWELLYSVDGDMKAWFYAELGTEAFTLEANGDDQGFQPDYATWRNSTVTRNRPGWQYFLDRVGGPAIWGHTIDACTGSPVAATLGIDEIPFSHGETPRKSEPGFGRFQWTTEPGSYHLNAGKAGYQNQDWPVDVAFKPAQRDIHLVPDGAFAVEVFSNTIQDLAGDGDGEADPGELITMPVTAYATGGSVTGLTGTLSTSDPYVTITDANGAWPSIAAGETAVTSDSFAFSVAPGAPDTHVVSFTLTFAASETLCASSSSFEVRITTGAPSCPAVDEPLDVNPGWTIDNTDSLGWAFGAPGGGGSSSGPTNAHTGTNVFGTNLAGSYGDNADYKLTTTAFNLTTLKNAELRFWRYLNNETGNDLASISVSTDGVNFTDLWSGFGYDNQWEPYRIDISAIADGKPQVYVRFRLQSDFDTTGSGFFIDDVSICGEARAPAPDIGVTSWTVDDAQSALCSDNDAYADAGEIADLTVNFKNNGNASASAVGARLSTTNPHVSLIGYSAPLGTLAPGASASATFRFKVASAVPCQELASFTVDLDGNGGSYRDSDASIQVTLQGDDGTPVPDQLDDFETSTPWVLTGDWQIQRPRGKGGAGNPTGPAGRIHPRPMADCASWGRSTGLGVSPGNYENNTANPIVATSPAYDCSNGHNIQLQFKRWLGVESSLFDHATIEAWDGMAWQVVWSNPSNDLSDASWQSVSYDVSRYADGNPAFKVRFKLTSNVTRVFCGWNIDDLRITNGYTPQSCESGSCAAGCTPSAQVEGVIANDFGNTATIAWTPSSDACHDPAGPGYRIYRSLNPAPSVVPPAQWPADSFFADVTLNDLDGNTANAAFAETAAPPPDQIFYYLVVDVGSNGSEGPKDWQGF